MKATDARNLHGQVIRELGTRIVSGELRPGEALPREEALAESMQVSRNALREALKVLAAKGLLEARPKTGTRVRPPQDWNQIDADVLSWRCATMPTDDFVEKLIEMREMIEPAAAAAAAERRSEAQLAAIEAAYRQMEAAADSAAWTAADLRFHEAVLQATGNELMSSLFSVIESVLGMFFLLSAQAATDFRYSIPHHRKVLDAIRRQQPAAARKAMQAMIVDSRENLAARRRRNAKKKPR